MTTRRVAEAAGPSSPAGTWGPDHRAQRLRHHRPDRPRAERAVLGPGAALGDAPEPGVYWFGVHALGTRPGGRDTAADGRARPSSRSCPERASGGHRAVRPPAPTHHVHPDGRLTDVPGWTRALSPGGRLRSLVDFGASAGSRPITWLVDPAVPDAVRRWRPEPRAPRAGRAAEGRRGGGSPGPSATADPTPDSSEGRFPRPRRSRRRPSRRRRLAGAVPGRAQASQMDAAVRRPRRPRRGEARSRRPRACPRARRGRPGAPARSSGCPRRAGTSTRPGLRLLTGRHGAAEEGAFLDPPPPWREPLAASSPRPRVRPREGPARTTRPPRWPSGSGSSARRRCA